MKECCQNDERDMDRWQIVCEPLGEVDIGYRAIASPKGFGKLGEGTVESIRRKNQTFATTTLLSERLANPA
jgi:hypothetical protein